MHIIFTKEAHLHVLMSVLHIILVELNCLLRDKFIKPMNRIYTETRDFPGPVPYA